MNPHDVPPPEAFCEVGLVGPYPTALIDLRVLPDRRRLVLRPVLPQDDHLLAAMINRVSATTRGRRFPSAGDEASVDQLTRLTCVDARRHLALVIATQEDGRERLVAEARYLLDDAGNGAEFTLMVDDAWQRLGVATWLLEALARAAEAQGVEWLWCDVPAGNEAMLGLMRHCRFGCRVDRIDPRIVRVETRPRVLRARRASLLPPTRLPWMPRWWPRAPRLLPVTPG